MSFQHVVHHRSHHRRTNVMPLKVQSRITQAVVAGDVPVVKQEILNGEDQNGTDCGLRTYLHLAAHFGREEVVKCLLSVDARVNAKDNNWLTPLHYACRKNHDIIAGILIAHGADIECRNKMWVTPLHVCAANNSLECAELFVDRIKNINVSDRSGATALHHAAFNGNCDMITFLLKKGCGPNAFDKKSRRPLHYAAAIDNSDSIRLLLQAGATINAHDRALKTPLHFAAASGSLNAVQTLLDHGADIAAVDADGNNALHWASLHGQDDVIEELLCRDPSLINLGNKSGMTPLHFAAGSEKGLSSLGVLLMCEEKDVNARDQHKRTAMHLAAKFARLVCLQELLRMDADATASDGHMMTPLHYAISTGNTKIIDALLDQPSVQPEIVDSSGMTPLHHAAFLGLSHVVFHLLHHPQKPSSALLNDITGRPAHFLAALSGDLESLQLLMSAYVEYAPVSLLDNFDRSPLHYAAAAGAAGLECLQYLLNYDVRVVDSVIRPTMETAATMPDEEHGEENGRESVDDEDSQKEEEKKTDDDAFTIGSKVESGNTTKNAFSVNQKDIFGRTPLMYACEFDEEGDSVELLISHAAKVDAMDSNGIYTINYAAAAGKVSAIKILLQTFYWNEVKFKVCPSQCAAFYGHTECLELLLKEGIYENLYKAIEYSRRSASGCFEVLESYIMSACSADESMAELTQYFTASDQSFHMQFLSNDTFSDLSQLEPIMSRHSLDDDDDNSHVCTKTSEPVPGDAESSSAAGESNFAIVEYCLPTKSEVFIVNGTGSTCPHVPASEQRISVNGFTLNNNSSPNGKTSPGAHATKVTATESKESIQLNAAVLS